MEALEKNMRNLMRSMPVENLGGEHKKFTAIYKNLNVDESIKRFAKVAYSKKEGNYLIQDIWSYNDKAKTVTYDGRMGFYNDENIPNRSFYQVMRPDKTFVKSVIESSYDTGYIEFEESSTASKRFFGDDKNAEREFISKCNCYASDMLALKKQEKAEKLTGKVEQVNDAFVRYTENDWTNDDVNYLFFSEKNAFCTSCKKNFPIKIKNRSKAHGIKEKCPECGKTVIWQSANKCKEKFIDDRYYMKFEKKGNDVLARFFCSCRTITKGDIKALKFTLSERLRAVISKEKCVYIKRNNKHWNNWEIASGCPSNGYNIYHGGYPQYAGNGSIYPYGLKKLVSETCLNKTGFQEFLDFNKRMTRRGAIFNSTGDIFGYITCHYHTCAYEWLLKSGFERLFVEKFYGNDYDYGLFDIKNATNLQSVMKVDKRIYNILYQHRGEIGSKILEAAHIFPDDSYEIWKEVAEANLTYYALENVKKLTAYSTVHKLLRYIKEQAETPEYKNSAYVLNDYQDYIRMSIEKQEFDKKNSMILFPRHLKEEHDRLVEWQRDYKESINMHELSMIDEILDEYHRQYDFIDKNDGLLITAPKQAEDIITEGKVQHICVGSFSMGYIKQMAHKETAILFIRKKEDADAPYYTMEVKNDSIVQVRGMHNCNPTDDVKNLVRKYASEKNLKLCAGF